MNIAEKLAFEKRILEKKIGEAVIAFTKEVGDVDINLSIKEIRIEDYGNSNSKRLLSREVNVTIEC